MRVCVSRQGLLDTINKHTAKAPFGKSAFSPKKCAHFPQLEDSSHSQPDDLLTLSITIENHVWGHQEKEKECVI